jgi:hypothetical protein
LRRHEGDHFGAEIDDVNGGVWGGICSGIGDRGCGCVQLNVGLLQALKGDGRGVNVGFIGNRGREL